METKVGNLTQSHVQTTKTVQYTCNMDYRRDILVTGIPASEAKTVDELLSLIYKIGTLYGVNVVPEQIFHITRLRDHKILVKFNSVFRKDKIMKNYLSEKNLKLSQLLSTNNVNSRVFLNNNQPLNTLRMMLYCRKLLKSKAIKTFKMNNKDCSVFITDCNDQTITIGNLSDLRNRFPMDLAGASGSST